VQPGDMVSPEIRLVRPLDEGSMGSIWVADHLGLGREIAVKFMSTAHVKDPNLVLRFSREAQAAARIESPHVARTLGHGLTLGGFPYIAMELLPGESLRARLDDVGRLSMDEAATIVRQICEALGCAHAVGVVHRDIKPANIFLTPIDDGLLVRLLDFGVAKVRAADGFDMTRTTDHVGTPYYMSPEQLFSAKHVDHRADLWSLSVVAYRCLTGEVPFKAETFGEVIVAVKRGVFAPPSALRPELPEALDAFFLRALGSQPALRFASAAELAGAFTQAIEG
jgi:eukaryotic-like serine/threonine-protein kinase